MLILVWLTRTHLERRMVINVFPWRAKHLQQAIIAQMWLEAGLITSLQATRDG